jgi:hypothetical protein
VTDGSVVKVGQVWKDNDDRERPAGAPDRTFKIEKVEPEYYPHGRALCKLLIELQKGQRSTFWARLTRFNGNKRGYSLVKDEHGKVVLDLAKPKKKGKKKAAGKKKASTRKKGGQKK